MSVSAAASGRVVGVEGAEERADQGPHAALEGLEGHVAGEAVGDDDVDVGAS